MDFKGGGLLELVEHDVVFDDLEQGYVVE